MVVTTVLVTAAFHTFMFIVQQAEFECDAIPPQVHLFISGTN